MTKKQAFTEIIQILTLNNANEELIAILNKELQALEKKATYKSKKVQDNIEINKSLATTIKKALINKGIGMTVTELIESDSDLQEYSNQKITYILNNWIQNEVSKTMIKGRSYYQIKEV